MTTEGGRASFDDGAPEIRLKTVVLERDRHVPIEYPSPGPRSIVHNPGPGCISETERSAIGGLGSITLAVTFIRVHAEQQNLPPGA